MESFFGIGIPELVLILVIAGIVMGPQRIGVAARWLGKTTAQLQSISRGFINQLNSEIDGIQEGTEIKGAMQDMQELRGQIEQLKQELLSVTNGAVRDGKQAVTEVQDEIERTIAPPLKRQPDSKSDDQPDNPVSSEGLPNRLEVPDDPEE